MNIEKNAYVFSMSKEMYLDMLAMKYGPPFTREVASRTETPPTEEQWAEYHRAVELLAELENNPCFYVGGSDCEVRVEEPQPKVHIEYAETEAEYEARVMALDPSEHEPMMDRFMRNAFASLTAMEDSP